MGMRRICKSCKLDWNVSRIEPRGKHYIYARPVHFGRPSKPGPENKRCRLWSQ